MASHGASPALSLSNGNGSSLSNGNGSSKATGLVSDASNGLSKPNNHMNGLSPNHVENVSPTKSDSPPKTKICVFCGSSSGNSLAHMEAARALGTAFHMHNISLVYGGGTVGLMGETARTLVALAGPESVHGIIPAPLVKYERGPNSAAGEITSGSLPSYETYGRTTVVKDMHTRKQMMAQEVLAGGPGSGFIALSGGYGTLEELMEVVTWNQLGIHNRGVVILNIEGYWDGLLQWVKGSVEAGFVSKASEGIMQEAKSAEEAVKALRGYRNAEGRFKLEWGNE